VLREALQKWRENYYVSKALVSVSRPVYKVAALFSTQIPRKIKNNGVTIILPNGRKLHFVRDLGIHMASSLYWHGLDGYEPATSRTLRFLFERVSIFVDVGANIGLYSLIAGLTNPKIHVMAFEPEPRLYKGLVENVKLNRLESQISTYQIALSNQTGKAEFYLPPTPGRDVESTGTIAIDSWQKRKEHTTLQVDTLRFDEFQFARPERIELMKIDVEDTEASVLCGMSKTILRDKPIIVCEILPRPHKNQQTLNIIRDLAYTPYWITSEGYIRVTDFDFPRKSHQDFLLSPRSGPAIADDLTSFI